MELLSFVTQFKVPHLSDYTLQIRIGECGLETGLWGRIDGRGVVVKLGGGFGKWYYCKINI